MAAQKCARLTATWMAIFIYADKFDVNDEVDEVVLPQLSVVESIKNQ